MKKILFVLAMVSGFAFAAQSQIKTDKLTGAMKSVSAAANTTAASSGLDVKSLSGGIMTKLTSALNLTDAQKPKVLTAVTGFLQSKSGIMALVATDKTQYASKLTGLTSDLTKKLKGILTSGQMTKFMGLNSPKLNSSDPVSQLFK